MTVPRQVVAGRTYLVSRRCTQRQFLLRPDARVNEIFCYCLGEAAARFGIRLHGWIAMSDHEHLVVTDPGGVLPAFLQRLHKNLATSLNAYWGRWENLWAAEPCSAVWLVEPGDRFDKLAYLLTNPVADHLVERVGHWPGACSWLQHLSGRPMIVRRPRFFFVGGGRMPEEVTLRVERLPAFEHLTEDEYSSAIVEAVRAKEQEAADERQATGKPLLGRRAVLRARHTDRPRTVEPRRGLRPHIASKNESRRIEELLALRAFRHAYHAARSLFVAGDRGVFFPFGSYGPRMLGLNCAPS